MKACIKKLLLMPALTVGLGLIPSGRVSAQTFTNLHSFAGSDGANPVGGLVLSGNTLYGTTSAGGNSGGGAVFKVNTDGSGFTILHSFTATSGAFNTNSDGVKPDAGLLLSGNTLFGTAASGGSSGNGTVYKINTDGSGFTTLHNFTGAADGSAPEGGLILSGTTLYGTAGYSGSSGWGTVFALNTNGTGFTNLHSFTAIVNSTNSDGAVPEAGLTLSGGILYGTTYYGGSSDDGTVFAVNTNGTGFRNLHSFTAYVNSTNSDGYYPGAALLFSGNTLYGTAGHGGGANNGTVFAVNTNGSGFAVLHSFTALANSTNSDGADPEGGLMLLGNTLYGTASGGGRFGKGTVFAINTDGTGFTNLYSFTGSSGGANPYAGLVSSGNAMYGAAYAGGSSGNGTVFSLSLPLDLNATSLTWNTTDAGLDFSYANLGAPLPVNTTAKIFWANGTNIANAFTNLPVYSTNIPAGFSGQATNHVVESSLNFPPANATYLLLVLDPDSLVTESNKTNNTLALRNTFRHVVLVMMENRSFDHFLGWLPGAEGRQGGKSYTNASGQSFTNWHLAPHFQGCGCGDPDHSFEGSRIALNTNSNNPLGACDGWLCANANDIFSIGYYLQDDLSFLGRAATNWTVCDHYFSAIMAETQPNRIYQHAAQTDALTNRQTTSLTLPTIWDCLSRSNVTGHYYYSGPNRINSLLTLWGVIFNPYSAITFGTDQFYQDCASGSLPAVSFVDPNLTVIDLSPGNDDHPYADIRNGEAFLAGIYNAVVASSNWSSTVLIINFDEGGGFFDHVAPPIVQVEPAEQALGNDGRLGFRVPCLVISPWSRRGYVSSEQFDHTSVLKLIENRWGLAPLTVRDKNAKDLADVLDFDHPNFAPPPVVTNVPAGPFGVPCQTLQVVFEANVGVALTWDYTCQKVTLQKATSPAGPWTDLTNSFVPPYVITPADVGQFNKGFFRYTVK